MPDTTDRLLTGALAGLAATAPMTLVMDGLYRALPANEKRGPLPPREITMTAADAVGVEDELPEEGKKALVGVAHFAYGAGAGAAFGLAAPLLPLGPVASGVAYGLAVWAGSYLGWLPALRVLPSATDEPAGKNAVMIAAHVVWGAALGALAGRAARSPGR
jgi:hypothetical protein